MIVGPGSRLGSYEVLSSLGAGGMGEVYQARDTNLGREVALKIVRPLFRDDPQHVERFRREAHVLAALNHPHIATVHDLKEADGIAFLVMELVSGETLRERLSAGPLSLVDALRIGSQVAAALEAAHEKGIVHRDLKPANIKITQEGEVKVLDFGLAKAVSGDESLIALSQSPTSLVSQGVILGTVPYMSPEQARGKPVDRRSDIWSFGCVMFETLTGRQPFRGETASDIIAAILEREPDWQALPPDAPPALRRLLRRCLEKEPGRRLRDMGDARLELDEALNAPGPGESSIQLDGRRVRRRGLLQTALWLAGGAVLGVFLATMMRSQPRAPIETAHFLMPLPGGERLANLDFPAVALSPDGSMLAYVATRGGRPQLFVRRLASLETAPIPGSADAIAPFFSPDSRWIAFFAGGKLKKAPLAGGAPSTICDAAIGFGGSWGPSDVIVFSAATGSALSHVPASGGRPTRLTTLDAAKGEFSHRWPELLPDGRTVLFTVGTEGSWDDAQIVAQSLSSGQRTVLVHGGTNPHYVASGHLLYAHDGTLMAAPFDAPRLQVTGTPVRVIETVAQSFDGAAQVSLSRSGSVVYVAGGPGPGQRRLIAVDRSGAATPLAAPSRAYATPRVSPDGAKLAVTISAEATEDIWLYDIAQTTLKQLTFDATNTSPVWTPDGESIAFTSNKAGAPNLFLTKVSQQSDERLATSDNVQVPGSWSADGRTLAFVERHPTTGRDVWMLPHDGDRTPRPYLTSPSEESAPRFSPDGRWVSYVSNESGRNDVYVRGADASSRRWQVSSGGGTEPVWARNGQQLFYREGDRMMVASLVSTGELRFAQPRMLFEGRFEKGTIDTANYDVTPDQRFIMIRASEEKPAQDELHVLLNWLTPTLSAPSRAR